MTLDETLVVIRKRGIVLRMQGTKIVYESPVGAMTPQLINSIKTYKAKIITLLSNGADTLLKGRPNWCLGCQHGRYETDDIGSKVLWCGLENREVLNIKKCVKGYWIKNEKGWPVTLQ